MMGRLVVHAPAWAWLLVFVAAPTAILLAIALAEADPGLPPFRLAWSLTGFATLVEDFYYLDALLAALRVAAMTAVCCLVVAYPMAMGIARAAPTQWRLWLTGLVLAWSCLHLSPSPDFRAGLR